MNPAKPQASYPPLTCLACGEFDGRYSTTPLTRGWVQSGGLQGPVTVCACCRGLGHHAPEGGIPECQTLGEDHYRRTYLSDHEEAVSLEWDTRLRIRAVEAAIRTYDAETEARTYASLAPIYGPDEAAHLMTQEPPL